MKTGTNSLSIARMERKEVPHSVKNVFSSLKQDKNSCWYGLFFFIAAVSYYHFLDQAFMLGDDYYYGTFLQNGLGSFFQEIKYHYESINGRILVHCVAALLLLTDTLFFPLFGLCCWIYLSFTLLRVQYQGISLEESTMFPRFCFLFSFLTVYLLTIDISILKETLLWISAFFNYILPVCCLVTLMLFLQKENYKVVVPLLSLFLGATTEQMGLISFVCILFLGAFHEYILRTPLYRWKSSCVLLLFGFCTVVFSPGSVKRMEMESAGGLNNVSQYLGTIRELTALIVSPEGAFFHVLSFFVLVALYLYFVDLNHIFALCYGVFALSQVYIFADSSQSRLQFLGIVFGFASVCIYFIITKRPYYVALLGGACGSLVSIVPSAFTEPRVMFPFLLLVGLAYGLMVLECMEAIAKGLFIGKRVKSKILTAKNPVFFTDFVGFVILCAVANHFVPATLSGLEKNMLIEKMNLEQVKNSAETKEIAFLMDYDLTYSHILFIHNGFHFNTYLDYYGIPSDVLFRTWSQEQPMVKINGHELLFPSYEKEDVVFVPLSLVVEALGGYYWWSPEQIEIGVRESLYIIKEKQIFIDSRTESGTEESLWDWLCSVESELIFDFYLPLMSASLMEELFDLRIFIEDGDYVVMWN